MIKLFNDLTKTKEEFKPLETNKIKIYVCGPTVYDSPHIGHARAAIAFDILRRYFYYKGYEVQFVSNYTDVDDKMIDRAHEKGISVEELANKYILEYEDMMRELNVIPPDLKPKATSSINAILTMIKLIIDKEYAYESNGSVYFDLEKFAANSSYNTLFMRNYNPDEAESDIDATNNPPSEKKSPRDFALWKAAKPYEPKWSSDWGEGRPGWHIECSAMVYQNMGKEIDIHAGGKDLIFPHHTNEIAQTEAALGTKLARYWVHNGFVNVNNEKMSKSLKNFFTIKDVIEKYSGMTIRFFLSSVNYKRPINYTIENLEEAKSSLEKIRIFYESIKTISTNKEEKNGKDQSELIEQIKKLEDSFFAAMDDDLNTAEALSQIYQLIKIINTRIYEEKKEISNDIKNLVLEFLLDFSNIFGIIIDKEKQMLGQFKADSSQFDELLNKKDNTISNIMEILINIRTELRKNKMYNLSDDIRDKLKDIGIEIDDLKGKSIWKYIN